MIEEVDAVYAHAVKEGRSELSYTEDFPRFRYLVAFMVRMHMQGDVAKISFLISRVTHRN